MRICYISRNYRQTNSAGSKAKSDIEDILDRMGAINIGLKRTSLQNPLRHFVRNLTGVVLAALRLRRGDILVLQYPLKKYYTFMCRCAHLRGAKVVTVIHDLNSFRSKRLTPSQEQKRLDHSDVIIAHNGKMQQVLNDYGVQHPILQLGIFDYLSPAGITQSRPMPHAGEPYSFFFLGNLNPASNSFVYDLTSALSAHPIHLYGNHLDEERFQRAAAGHEHLVSFHGYAKDFELMACNEGDFGLSWYGESLAFGKGKIGEYMAINNPHKVSLYLRCQCPVILWKHAGLADFIEKEGCGILVDSIDNLEGTLSAITPEQYNTMMDNVRRVSSRIASGYYFEHALQEALCTLGISRP